LIFFKQPALFLSIRNFYALEVPQRCRIYHYNLYNLPKYKQMV
jgi:hypothetical protein